MHHRWTNGHADDVRRDERIDHTEDVDRSGRIGQTGDVGHSARIGRVQDVAQEWTSFVCCFHGSKLLWLLLVTILMEMIVIVHVLMYI